MEIVADRWEHGKKVKVAIYKLKENESIRGEITRPPVDFSPFADALIAAKTDKPYLQEPIKKMFMFANYEKEIFGEIEVSKVCVTCVPKENDIVHEYFPNLPEIEFE